METFYWIKDLEGQKLDVKYTDIYIVPTLIARHKKNYGYMKHTEVMHTDIVQSRLNESYDINFSRDMLQHLKFTSVKRVFVIKNLFTTDVMQVNGMMSVFTI